MAAQGRQKSLDESPQLRERIAELQERLAEAEETLRALGSGEVDAVIVSGEDGEQVYTLKGADQTYRLFIEQMAEGAVTLMPDGLIVFSNEQFSDLLGVPREALIGSQIKTFADADNAAILSELLAVDVHRRKQEMSLTTAAGRSVPVYVAVSKIRQDAVDCVCAIVTDLTQVKARAMLAESEERFRTLVSIITDVPLTVDPAGRFVGPQPAWAAYTGQTWEMFRDFGWINAFHAEDRQQVRETWERAREAGSLYKSRGRLWQASSEGYRYVEIRATPLMNNAGSVREWVGTCTDVEDRSRFEMALREGAERLRFMAESMPQKIFTADREGNIDYFNRQWMEYTGLSFEETKGWGWTKSVHPDDVDENIRLWRQSIETGEFFQFIQRFLRKDGMYRWHLTRAQAMRDSQGRISTWIGSNTDIHEQKEIEAELRRANDDLSQFAFAASHDLQEPLRMITSYSQLLVNSQPEQLDEQATMCLGYITDGSRQMRELLSDLLAYTQLTGAHQNPIEPIDLNLILRRTLANCAIAIQESGAEITCDTLPTVPGHESRYVQLLQNLIGNAIKYRGENAPRIHVSAIHLEDCWRVSVADNGVGIDPQFRHKIFGVFKRLHGRGIPGTGIGLAICQRIVEKYGGEIWVESELGQGATFHFTLPVLKGA